jgi:tetratricopeptide (TPR) repeat protein
MKRIRLTLALLAALMFADGFHGVRSFAQTPQDWALCLGGDLNTPDRPIEGCTAVINTGRQVLQRLATAYNNRGVAYRIKGNYVPAIDDFNEAIRLVPDYASAFNNRGVAYRNMGNLVRAVDDYDQAIRIKPDYVAAYYNRGLALTDKGEYGKAISDFTVVLRVDPKNPIVIYRRGEAYLKSGEVDAANADLAQATAIRRH